MYFIMRRKDEWLPSDVQNYCVNVARILHFRPSYQAKKHIAGQILVKFEFSRQIFEKHSNPSSGRQVVPCGQTDEQTWRS